MNSIIFWVVLKWKTNNTKLPEHFQNKISESLKKSKSIPIEHILIISIFFRSTRIIRSISDELEQERILYRPDNPCRAKKNTNNFFIGNFTILTQICHFFFNTNNFFIGNFTILIQLCDFLLLCFYLSF
jgi:hypothetical protein